MSDFINLCVRGKCLLDDIDDYVEAWHGCDSSLPLHSYLGMSRPEYSLWMMDPDILPFIVEAHRQHRNVNELIDESCQTGQRFHQSTPNLVNKNSSS